MPTRGNLGRAARPRRRLRIATRSTTATVCCSAPSTCVFRTLSLDPAPAPVPKTARRLVNDGISERIVFIVIRASHRPTFGLTWRAHTMSSRKSARPRGQEPACPLSHVDAGGSSGTIEAATLPTGVAGRKVDTHAASLTLAASHRRRWLTALDSRGRSQRPGARTHRDPQPSDGELGETSGSRRPGL